MKKYLAKLFIPFKWLFGKVGDGIYAVRVAIHQKLHAKGDKDALRVKNRDKLKDMAFYWIWLAVPLAFFLLVNVFINGNAIIMAFEKWDDSANRFVFAGFDQFKEIFADFANDKSFFEMLWRSFWIYLLGNVTSLVPILFAYYIYKKYFGWKVFRVLLFIPSLLSSIITVSIFRIVANEVIPKIAELVFGKELRPLLGTANTVFGTLLFYSIWMGLGGTLLTQLAAMNNVDPSVTESAMLDGVGFFGEFWHIVLPASYQVLAIGYVVGVAGIFTNQLGLYSFYGTGAPGNSRTIGYWIYVETLNAEDIEYPYLSALGVLITAIVAPLTMLLRHVVFKYGPSEDTREKRKKVSRVKAY